MTTSTPSMVQIVLIGWAAGVVTAGFAWRSRTTMVRIFWLVLTLGLLVPSGILGAGMNPWLVDARFRTYRVFYWTIRLGMTREEVLALMQNHYPPDEGRMRPKIAEDSETRLGFHMNPEHASEPNREAITLKMQGGKVVGKNYSPDTMSGR